MREVATTGGGELLGAVIARRLAVIHDLDWRHVYWVICLGSITSADYGMFDVIGDCEGFIESNPQVFSMYDPIMEDLRDMISLITDNGQIEEILFRFKGDDSNQEVSA